MYSWKIRLGISGAVVCLRSAASSLGVHAIKVLRAPLGSRCDSAALITTGNVARSMKACTSSTEIGNAVSGHGTAMLLHKECKSLLLISLRGSSAGNLGN